MTRAMTQKKVMSRPGVVLLRRSKSILARNFLAPTARQAGGEIFRQWARSPHQRWRRPAAGRLKRDAGESARPPRPPLERRVRSDRYRVGVARAVTAARGPARGRELSARSSRYSPVKVMQGLWRARRRPCPRARTGLRCNGCDARIVPENMITLNVLNDSSEWAYKPRNRPAGQPG
jgi:hypothetical protein